LDLDHSTYMPNSKPLPYKYRLSYHPSPSLIRVFFFHSNANPINISWSPLWRWSSCTFSLFLSSSHLMSSTLLHFHSRKIKFTIILTTKWLKAFLLAKIEELAAFLLVTRNRKIEN
jgi:hypothetical protein